MIAALLSHNSFANDFEIAEKYLLSYSHFDLEEMEKYYSEDAVFKDLTSENFGDNSFIMKGRKNTLERFRTTVGTNFNLDYKFINKFESSDHHVFISDVTSRTNKGEDISYSCGSVVSIIKIVNSKVVSHIDYADYRGFMQSSKNDEKKCRKF